MSRLLKLDRMEIIGFKSFYGRTLFEFPEGITAVVGPNGCGKSNIGDAISWVLGEQRASSLRSDRMEDVIFNGSDAKRPLGMAEVSLHFKSLEAVDRGHNGHGADGAVARAVAGNEVALPIAEVLEVAAAEPALAGSAPEEAEERPRPRFLLEEIPGEVVVTRRLYRSGESEYALNGQRCRLKDIQELLARTQIGTRLYTTIEQGKIDQILTSKPKERRAIIEEAAGILGYKAKRRQAELKLEAAQANLLRLSDITGEVEKQIGALKRQAAKARRYRRLQETLRARRASIAHRKVLACDEEHRRALEGSDALRASEAAAAAALARADADVEALRLRLEEGEEASRRRREAIHALDMEIDRLKVRLRAGEEQARDLTGRIGGAGGEIESLLGRAAEQEARCASLEAEIGQVVLRAGEAEAELRRVEEERRDRARAIEEREASLATARADLMAHLDLLSGTTQARATLEEQVRSGRTALDRLEHEAGEARQTLDRLGREVAALEEHARDAGAARREKAEERDRLASRERGAAEGLLLLERRSEEMRGRAAAFEERLAALREMERQHAGYSRGVAEILDGAAGIAAAGVVGERIAVPRGLERAAAAALEGILEGVLVPDAAEAARGVDHLRRTASGRVAFVPPGRVRAAAGPGCGAPAAGERPAPDEARAALPREIGGRRGVVGLLGDRVGAPGAGGIEDCAPVDAVLARTVLVEDLAAALELSAAFPGWAWVTPQGDIVRKDGVVIGGEGDALQHGVLARRAEREEIAGQVAAAGAERAAAGRTLEEGRAGLVDLRTGLAAAAASLQEADREALEVDLRTMQKRGEIGRIGASLPLLASEAQRQAAALAGRGAESERLAAGFEAAEARRRELEESIRLAADDLACRRAEHEAIAGRESGARAAMAAGQERCAALAREKEAIEAALGELRARTGRRAAEKDEWADRVSGLEASAVSGRHELDRALAARADEAARDEAVVAGLAYERSLLHAREQAAKEGRAAHEGIRRDLQDVQLQLARLDADLRHLEATCREDLGTTLETLRESPAPEPAGEGTLQEDEKEIERIKADLDAIGPVNLMAIEQCTELEERFGFLVAQRADLETSIASLRETIRKINRESRERFRAAFEAIQRGFQVCFATLFGGGTAELRLQEGEEDVLEAGIEIAAQPPGKRLQSMALLSGGEKALTAVALLFSLFRYRPSPFCVLDEVDAPLDEANVERFTGLLQQLREDTQFIVITHNRKSMEAADLLYGVTMEEPGVSKVLPLRFE